MLNITFSDGQQQVGHLLKDIDIVTDIDIFIATLVYMVYTSSILQRNINKKINKDYKI